MEPNLLRGDDRGDRVSHPHERIEVGTERFHHDTWPSLAASWCRNKPTSVTIPSVCAEPRSASFVTTAGLMSTHTTRTQLGSMLPTPIECSIVDSMITILHPSSALA